MDLENWVSATINVHITKFHEALLCSRTKSFKPTNNEYQLVRNPKSSHLEPKNQNKITVLPQI
jgi:hypothetical protein